MCVDIQIQRVTGLNRHQRNLDEGNLYQLSLGCGKRIYQLRESRYCGWLWGSAVFRSIVLTHSLIPFSVHKVFRQSEKEYVK